MNNLIYYVLLTALFTTGCTNNRNTDANTAPVEGIASVISDAELVSEDGMYILAHDSALRLGPSVLRSDSIAHSGKYSLKLTQEFPYGFTVEIDKIRKNEIISAEFWCYGFEPVLVFCDSGNVYYVATNKVIASDSTGWKKIGHRFRAPGNLHHSKLSVYVWNPGHTSCYIDDFSFERKPVEIRKINPDMLLRIKVDAADMSKLEAKRNEAFSEGVLESGDDDFVKISLYYMDDTLKGSMRLKGDWLDHLRGDKWSYRIKLKSKYSWKEMKTFSLQTPESRSFIDEWLAHMLFDREDVLTTRYGFINVELNGQDMGVYAYEEHFDKHLAEYNNRREGPIVRFAEEWFWLSNKLNLNADKIRTVPTFQECIILPFKMNKTAESPELLGQFENAQNLMMMYREWDAPLESIFDPDKLARYAALIDITKGYHALPLNNQRFYFNPVLCSLEPIAFDCYTEYGVFGWGKNTILGDVDSPDAFTSNKYDLVYQYFLNEKFRDLYLQYLKKYSDERCINSFLQEHRDEISSAEALLREEFFDYQYDDSFLLRNASVIRKLDCLGRDKLFENDWFDGLAVKTKPFSFDTIISPGIPPYYVQAYFQRSLDNERVQIRVTNNYSMDITIIGYADSDNKRYLFPQPFTVRSLNRKGNKREISTPQNTTALLYSIPVFPDVFQVNIYPWKFPENYSPRIELIEKAQQSFITRYASGRKIIIPAGRYEIKEPVVIPEGYECEIMAGASLNFTGRAFFLSYSPVKALGEENNKIIIRSADGTSMGFIVLQSGSKSVLSQVVFDQLNAMNYNGWILTGAVTFYESDVEMTDVSFTNNRCEDALNIIRSDFVLKNCHFDNISGDAFDSDFSTGSVIASDFTDMKNDALDLSGSNITLRDCTIKNAGDKGISGGERSRLVIENVQIANTNIALASKDNSWFEIRNSSVTASKYGFTAYTKKTEYKGAATLKADKVTMKDICYPEFIEKECVLITDGKAKKGMESSVFP